MKSRIFKITTVILLVVACTLCPTDEVQARKFIGEEITYEIAYIDSKGCPWIYQEFDYFFLGIKIFSDRREKKVDPSCGSGSYEA
jgi:hypothetical protein